MIVHLAAEYALLLPSPVNTGTVLWAHRRTTMMLAGERYWRQLLEPIQQMSCTGEVPLQGLRMGEQLHWLNTQLSRMDDLA